MKTILYMVRHADSPYVPGQERTRGLSAAGAAASRQIAERLKDLPVDGVVSSSYARAVQTVQPLAESRGLPIREYEGLRERLIGGEESEAPWEEIRNAIERSFTDHDYALEGGETTKEARLRALPILEELLEEYEGRAVAIGTHGNIMTILMNHYEPGCDYAFWQETSRPDVYRMTFDGRHLESIERLWSPEAVHPEKHSSV
ncbi:histidine phosphatase family protein [Paenibacillus aurantius]|uniref:Histidine phosphatase family protein n=1 Tax=Paenibacillus aurantius TaxID=2918900 RepID=A0AA96RFY6_9BACL|nr:histidine phosphatase family protein [Paenibacillus aurantius]WNQ11981.1 histidine phosphatase family protein [Paenibacillus aurantius]